MGGRKIQIYIYLDWGKCRWCWNFQWLGRPQSVPAPTLFHLTEKDSLLINQDLLWLTSSDQRLIYHHHLHRANKVCRIFCQLFCIDATSKPSTECLGLIRVLPYHLALQPIWLCPTSNCILWLVTLLDGAVLDKHSFSLCWVIITVGRLHSPLALRELVEEIMLWSIGDIYVTTLADVQNPEMKMFKACEEGELVIREFILI